jgi:hypothetical protein
MWGQARLTPVGTWDAAGYRALHDQLEAELADLQAVVAAEVELEVTYALSGVVPSRWLPPHVELMRRRELHPLPPDHPLARREPWWPDQLIPTLDELTRRPGEGWWS